MRQKYLLDKAREIVEAEIETKALEKISEKQKEIRSAKRLVKKREEELGILLANILKEYEL